MPQRIQLSRKKGWRKPECAVVVARPTKWGNPVSWLALREDYGSEAYCRQVAVERFEDGLAMGDFTYPSMAEIVRELAGRDLACWCPLDHSCHADVLLELANPKETP